MFAHCFVNFREPYYNILLKLTLKRGCLYFHCFGKPSLFISRFFGDVLG